MNESLLRRGLETLRVPFQAQVLEKIRIYFQELMLWNQKIGLVRGSGDEIITRHILDSLTGWHLISSLSPASLADVGSGAGFPGLPLALFLPDTRVTLIERSFKKAAFLNNVRALLGLDNLRVLERRIEEVKERFAVVSFRALGRFQAYYAQLLRVTAEGGCLVAYKGRKDALLKELDFLADLETVQILPVLLPFHPQEERHLLVIKK